MKIEIYIDKKIKYNTTENILSITGSWDLNNPELDTNAKQFNDYMKLNPNKIQDIELLKKEAAKQTWTGQQAEKYGFTDIELIGNPQPINGEYKFIQIKFKKPNVGIK